VISGTAKGSGTADKDVDWSIGVTGVREHARLDEARQPDSGDV
jgi:hypothetical protein